MCQDRHDRAAHHRWGWFQGCCRRLKWAGYSILRQEYFETFQALQSALGFPPPGKRIAVRDIFLAARKHVRQAVNETMVQAYWHIGRLIVEDEQGGATRAGYGKRVLPELAKRLSVEFEKGFSAKNLWDHRQFSLEFPNLSTLWRDSHWSHLKILMRVKDQLITRPGQAHDGIHQAPKSYS